MTCSSTFLKYPLAVLVQTPATYILTYCDGCSTAFNFLLHIASNSGKRYWDCKLPCIKALIELSSTFVHTFCMLSRVLLVQRRQKKQWLDTNKKQGINCCYCLGKSFRCFAIFVILPFCVLNTPHQEGQDRMGFGCAEVQGEYKTSFASSFSDFLDCSTFCSTASWPVCECILVHSKVNLFFYLPFL